MIYDIGRRGIARLAISLPVAILAAMPLAAGENAILTNGFRIHADRHEVAGDRVKLYVGGGFTELPADEIARFEKEEDIRPAPSPVIAPQAAPAPAAKTAPPVTAALNAGMPPPSGAIDPKRLAAESAERNKLPEALIRSVMHAESGFQQNAISPKGAIGLMQLMPETAQELHADPYDPRQNVEAGTAYLRDLVIKYENQDDGVARAVAAYNAGPGAVDRYHGVPPYRETREYVIRVLTEYQKLLHPQASPPANSN